MKKQKRIAFLLIALIGFAGCSKEQGSTAIDRSAAALAPNSQWAHDNGITVNGDIKGDTTQSAFQDTVSGFIEARFAPELLGYVSANASGGTGVFFGGRVELQSGALNTQSSQQINVRSDSKMIVEVWDEFAGRADANGEMVPPLSRIFTSATGYVSGNQAYIRLSDEYGTVELSGTFTRDVFYGQFEYDNSRRWDGAGQGAAGIIGQFRLPTCQFFRCQ